MNNQNHQTNYSKEVELFEIKEQLDRIENQMQINNQFKKVDEKPKEDEYLTSEDIMKRLKISRSGFNRIKKYLPIKKIMGKLYVTKSDFEKSLDKLQTL